MEEHLRMGLTEQPGSRDSSCSSSGTLGPCSTTESTGSLGEEMGECWSIVEGSQHELVLFGQPGTSSFRALFVRSGDASVFASAAASSTSRQRVSSFSPSSSSGVSSLSASPRRKDAVISAWHDIPLYDRECMLHGVCTTPAGTWLQHQFALQEDYTPLHCTPSSSSSSSSPLPPLEASSGAAPTIVPPVAHLPYNCPWNICQLPQTRHDPDDTFEHRMDLSGSGAPLGIIDIGRIQARLGQVYSLKPIAAFPLQTGPRSFCWQLVGIAGDNPLSSLINSAEEMEIYFPGELQRIREWLVESHQDDALLAGSDHAPLLTPAPMGPDVAHMAVAQANASWQLFVDQNTPPEAWQAGRQELSPGLLETIWRKKYDLSPASLEIPIPASCPRDFAPERVGKSGHLAAAEVAGEKGEKRQSGFRGLGSLFRTKSGKVQVPKVGASMVEREKEKCPAPRGQQNGPRRTFGVPAGGAVPPATSFSVPETVVEEFLSTQFGVSASSSSSAGSSSSSSSSSRSIQGQSQRHRSSASMEIPFACEPIMENPEHSRQPSDPELHQYSRTVSLESSVKIRRRAGPLLGSSPEDTAAMSCFVFPGSAHCDPTRAAAMRSPSPGHRPGPQSPHTLASDGSRLSPIRRPQNMSPLKVPVPGKAGGGSILKKSTPPGTGPTLFPPYSAEPCTAPRSLSMPRNRSDRAARSAEYPVEEEGAQDDAARLERSASSGSSRRVRFNEEVDVVLLEDPCQGAEGGEEMEGAEGERQRPGRGSCVLHIPLLLALEGEGKAIASPRHMSPSLCT